VIVALDAIGFDWDYKDTAVNNSWLEALEALRKFKERTGHCNVSTYEEDISLGRWVVSQRVRRKKGILSVDQIRLLDELGFVWDFQAQKAQETWMKWYLELENYVREQGDSQVPRTYANTKLASWVWIQRAQRKKGIWTNDQIQLLDELGFVWSVRKGRRIDSNK
jgi:hypothetical protein